MWIAFGLPAAKSEELEAKVFGADRMLSGMAERVGTSNPSA
jgi:chemotaxis receptor (MCP) glutamine deamidase CheD